MDGVAALLLTVAGIIGGGAEDVGVDVTIGAGLASEGNATGTDGTWSAFGSCLEMINEGIVKPTSSGKD